MKDKKFAHLIIEEIRTSISGVCREELMSLVEALQMDKRIFCDGAGRSRLQAEGFAMRLTQMGFCSVVVGEATTPAITGADILFICSGSGETPVLVEHAIRAREKGARVLVITAGRESSLEKISDSSLHIDAPSKLKATQHSVQPMGSLFEQSVGIICDSIVLYLMEKYKISSEDMYKNHSNLE